MKVSWHTAALDMREKQQQSDHMEDNRNQIIFLYSSVACQKLKSFVIAFEEKTDLIFDRHV